MAPAAWPNLAAGVGATSCSASRRPRTSTFSARKTCGTSPRTMPTAMRCWRWGKSSPSATVDGGRRRGRDAGGVVAQALPVVLVEQLDHVVDRPVDAGDRLEGL